MQAGQAGQAPRLPAPPHPTLPLPACKQGDRAGRLPASLPRPATAYSCLLLPSAPMTPWGGAYCYCTLLYCTALLRLSPPQCSR